MRIKSKKGFVLALIMIFVIIAMISSIGLYLSTEFLAREIRAKEVRHIQGYYADIAGLRYASILLRNPARYGIGAAAYTVTGTELGGNFFLDIDAVGRLTVVIDQIASGDDAGDYNVSATYSY